MKPIIPEKAIEKHILAFLRAKGIFAWKNQSQGTYDAKKGVYRRPMNPFMIKGVSDILGILPDGKFLAIEVKSARGKPSDDQRDFIERILRDNGVAFVARSVEEVELALFMGGEQT